MTYAAVAVGGASLLGGLSSSRSSKKAQKEANAIARESGNCGWPDRAGPARNSPTCPDAPVQARQHWETAPDRRHKDQ